MEYQLGLPKPLRKTAVLWLSCENIANMINRHDGYIHGCEAGAGHFARCRSFGYLRGSSGSLLDANGFT